MSLTTDFPTAKEFLDVLRAGPLEDTVHKYLYSGFVYAFKDCQGKAEEIKTYLSASLKVDKRNIHIVGSGKIGFSLNPEAYARPFRNTSDIDIMVHDSALFDRIWHTILRWHYPNRRYPLLERDYGWAGDRKKDIYWGWLHPASIRFNGISRPEVLKPLRDIAALWFGSFQSLSRFDDLAERKFSGRLYRTLDHATMYHVQGFREILNG